MNRFFYLAGRACVLGVLVVTPWANEGSEPALLRYFFGAIFASAFFALAALWTAPRRERQKNAYGATFVAAIPLILGLAIGFLQIFPLSDATLARISPRVLELKTLLLPPNDPERTIADVSKPDFQAPNDVVSDEILKKTNGFLSATFPFVEGATFDSRTALAVDAATENEFLPKDAPEREVWGKTISLYPLATREYLSLFFVATLLFISSSILFNSNESRRFFWKTVALNGLAFALFALSVRANPGLKEKEFFANWLSKVAENGFGTYCNKNAAAGYLVLCLGPALGLVALGFFKTVALVQKDRAQQERDRKRESDNIYKSRGEARWKRILGDVIDLFDRRFVVWAIVSGALIASIFASLSRGASIAATVALVALVVAVAFRKNVRRYWPLLATTAAIALATVLWTGLGDRVDARMSTLIEDDEEGMTAVESDARWENWRGAAKTSRDYFWFGSGLGTFGLANQNNDVILKEELLFYFPENTFVQTLLETGVLGLLLLIGEYVVLLGVVGKILLEKHSVETLAVAIGGLTLILGQLVAGMGDFGIYLPANIFLFAALCGSLVGRRNGRFWENLNAALGDKTKAPKAICEAERARRRERVGAVLVSILFVGAFAGAPWIFAQNADYVERTQVLRESKFAANEVLYSSVESVDRAIADLERYVARRDDCYEIRTRLADLTTKRFRIQYLAFLKQENSGVSDEILWNQTAPAVLTSVMLGYQRLGLLTATDAIRDNVWVRESLSETTRHLIVARRICPLDAGVHSQLALLVPATTKLSWARERDEIELCARRVASFSQFHSRELFRCGVALRLVDLAPLWSTYWRRSLEYNSKNAGSMMETLELGTPPNRLAETVELVLPDEARTLRRATAKYVGKKDSPVFAALKEKGSRYFDSVDQELRDVEYYYENAMFQKYVGEYQKADENFVAALELEPFNADLYRGRAILLCECPDVLGKEEECLELLRKYRLTRRGKFDLKYNYWFERATRNFNKRQAREKAQERMRREREEEERVQEK